MMATCEGIVLLLTLASLSEIDGWFSTVFFRNSLSSIPFPPLACFLSKFLVYRNKSPGKFHLKQIKISVKTLLGYACRMVKYLSSGETIEIRPEKKAS